jgi:hypothetical protein
MSVTSFGIRPKLLPQLRAFPFSKSYAKHYTASVAVCEGTPPTLSAEQ